MQAGLLLTWSQASKTAFLVTRLRVVRIVIIVYCLFFFIFYGCVSLSHRLIFTENRKQKVLFFALSHVKLHFST